LAEEREEPDLGTVGGNNSIASVPEGPDLGTVHGSNTIADAIDISKMA
jgi:hypothetical protein